MIPTTTVLVVLRKRCPATFIPLSLLILIILTMSLHWTLIIRIKSHLPSRFLPRAAPVVGIATRACGARFFEEEGEEFVGDGEVGGLLVLLKGGEADEHFEDGEG